MPPAKHNSTIGKGYGVDFARCSFIPRHAFLLTTVHTIHASWTYLVSFFVFQFFWLIIQGVYLNSTMWIFTGSVMPPSRIFGSNLRSLRRSFLHCCSFVMLCNEWIIATYEQNGYLTCRLCDGLLRAMAFFTFCPFVTGFMQRRFLYICNDM